MACSVKEFVRQHEKELVDLTCQITLIPAPSRHEDARAAFCAQWLRDRGAKDVYIDADKNVVCPICQGRSGKWIVVSAHMDTVFPFDTPLEIRREGDRLYCPGIGDDSANLAILMIGMRWLLENPPVDNEYGILFVATAAEEIGSVGMRGFVDRFGAENIYRCYSFDACNNRLYIGTVNYYKYVITVRTPGGHALGKFGMPSAIEELAKVMLETSRNCREYIAQNELKRTTINVGTFHGGERSNIIASEAQMLLELRSDTLARMQVLEGYLQDAMAHYRSENVQITAERMADAAHWSTVEEAVMEELGKEHYAMMHSFGLDPRISKACTDCRYPMHKGIPSLDVGLCYTVGPHTKEEYLVPDSLPTGLELLLTILQSVL